MLRIYFSGEDVARTRLASTPDPVWELVLSLHVLGARPRDPVLAGWRTQVVENLRSDPSPCPDLAFFCAVNPPYGYFPDFLTPAQSLSGLEAGLDAICATPVAVLRRDLELLPAGRPVPAEVRALGRGEPATLTRLAGAMRRYQARVVTPYWSRIQTAVAADRARRGRTLLDRGLEGLFTDLGPTVRWQSGVLEVPGYPHRRELHLDGRGLLLVPSFFCSRIPVTLRDPDLPPVLVYPVDRLGGLTPARSATGRPRAGATQHRTDAVVPRAAGVHPRLSAASHRAVDGGHRAVDGGHRFLDGPLVDDARLWAGGGRPHQPPLDPSGPVRSPVVRQSLAALLGRTRASVLEVVGDGCSTGEVARRLGISQAAASQHATVLRNAGLLVSQRHRNTVLHMLTPLGRAVLDQ